MRPASRLAILALGLNASLMTLPALAAPKSEATTAEASCARSERIAVLPSPVTPWSGAPLRVIIVSEKDVTGEVSLVAPDGSVATATKTRRGGPPYFWTAEVAQPAAGNWKAQLVRDGSSGECGTITRAISVKAKQPARIAATSKSVWPVRAAWDRDTENLYSAWIEALFDAPIEETLSWPALHEVLRDPSRNLLFNHLSLGEDQKGLVIRPDCADLPYFLRAYFAFKLGLPFGYAKCTRGGGGRPPKCVAWWNIEKLEPPTEPQKQQSDAGGGLMAVFGGSSAAKPAAQLPEGLVPGFGYYLRTIVANGVHSGSGRTAANDNSTDYYPVPLTADALRPGTVYADPYGHLLVIAKRVPQTPEAAGVILAVDGQPDGTVSRKRFWRGNFLFAQDPALGGPGFKRFRPIVATKKGGLVRLANADITAHPAYGDFSLDQSKLDVEAFYDRMDDVMSPNPLDPEKALLEAIVSLEEQVKARVTSVENGRKYQVGGGGQVSMPDGPSIFETTGPWEDFATPSRDLRLLIAIDVVRKFPERVARRPERYAMPKGKSTADVKAALEAELASEVAARKFEYTRTDGSPWPLTLKDVLDRAPALEVAYNLNDCVEHRWGAAEGSDEAKTCKRRAPEGQQSKMSEYRAWFSDRRRPPRG